MNLTRREFARGGLAALGFLALPGGLFAAHAGWKPSKKPNLVLGVMSDSHLRVGYDAVTPGRAFPLDYIRNAFKLFKAKGIDAFVHCGDAAHRGCVREWEFHKEVFEEVFGKKDAPQKIIVVGNHELFEYAKVWWPDDWQERQINFNLAKNYERVWGVPYAGIQHWEVKGYHFFGRHWETDEMKLAEFINDKAGGLSLAGTKPFFILSHARNHFKCNHALRAFPNAIAFFGHWHQSNADWKSIYYDSFGGFFPNIEIGACRAEDGGNDLDHDGSDTIRVKAAGDGQRVHNNKLPSRQAMIVNVFDDMVVFERHEVGEGGKLGPDWVLPLGVGKPHPFSREELAKACGAPQFDKMAKLEAAKKAKGLVVKIPMADGNPDSRVYAYNVVVVGDDPKARLFKSVFFEGANLGVGHEPNKGVTEVEIPISELPAGKKLTVAVRPVSSLGTKGKALGTTWKS